MNQKEIDDINYFAIGNATIEEITEKIIDDNKELIGKMYSSVTMELHPVLFAAYKTLKNSK